MRSKEVKTMYLKNSRAFVQGIMRLVFAIIAGMPLVAFMGVIKLKEISLGYPLEVDGFSKNKLQTKR